jgi:hypothetical protein
MTRETTKLVSVSESVFKGTDAVYDDINDLFPKLNQLKDIPEIRESKISKEEDLNTGLSSKYEIKLRKPQASIDLNLPAPVEEHPEFSMNIIERRKDRNQIHEILYFSCFSPYLQEHFMKRWR